MQILLPVAFFSLMCIPKHYIKPFPHPVLLPSSEFDLDSNWWAGGTPYTGPAMDRNGSAIVAFAPDRPTVREVADLFAKAVACPAEPFKRTCSSTITSFYCLFAEPGDVPEQCQDQSKCMSTAACWQPVRDRHVRVLDSEGAAVEYAMHHPRDLDALVVFDGNGALEYRLRMNHTDIPSTQLLLDLFDVSPGLVAAPGNALWEYRRYWAFVNLQLALDRAILGLHQNGADVPADVRVRVKPFPWPATVEDLGAASAAAFFNLLLVYAFMTPTRAVVSSIVREKELRLREGMRILGLTEAAYWASWSLTHWSTLAASSVLCAVVGLYPFRHSSFTLMVAFFWSFAAALIAFSYCLSTLFSASRVAGTATQFLYALSMMPGFLLPVLRPYGGASWYVASLMPPSAASLFANALVNWERVADGVNWHTLSLPVVQGTRFSVATVFLMLWLDVALFAALTWYLDKVLPTSYGQRLPFYFPFTRSYWQHGEGMEDDDSRNGKRQLLGTIAEEGPPAVQLVNLRKVFRSTDGGTKVAVDGISVSMHRGRITALLGHNGAGKTTTIHILTGMLQATSGAAYVDGHDISTDMAHIRRSLSVCPQFDILWPDITAREHLQLYAAIKGYSRQDAAALAEQAAAEVALEEKLDVMAGELSGGQRRKLSVAIAFLGNPAVVFLDEPTSGMDPYSRRFTWDVIRAHKADTAIVLTTHSMEEADVLCDDIIILADGRVAAEGTSLQLKGRYGVGYTLSLVMSQQQQQQQQYEDSPHAGSGSAGTSPTPPVVSRDEQVARVKAAVKQRISGAELISSAGAEVAFRLPREQSGQYAALLRQLDAQKAELGVDSYGLSVTTLEEVFLNITSAVAAAAEERDGLLLLQQHQPRHQDRLSFSGWTKAVLGRDGGGSSSRGGGYSRLVSARSSDSDSSNANGGGSGTSALHPGRAQRGGTLYLQQLRALFIKRALCARRDKLAVVTQLLIPLLLVYLALWVSDLTVRSPDEPALAVGRDNCLMGHRTLLGATPDVRAGNGSSSNGSSMDRFLDVYSRKRLHDTGLSYLYAGYSTDVPLNRTMEGYLLDNWHSGKPHYDALFLTKVSTAESFAAGDGQMSLTLLVNQSAISALPAALNQASSALLRLIRSTSPLGDSSTQQPGHPLSQRRGGAVDSVTAAASAMTQEQDTTQQQQQQQARIRSRRRLAEQVPLLSESSIDAITTTNHPLPTLPNEAELQLRQETGSLTLVLCLTMASSVLSAAFVVFLVREQDNNSKHVQMVSGAPASAYWLANYAWDMLSYSLPACGMLVLFWLYDLPQFQGPRMGAVAALLWMFGLAGLSLTYLLHFLFSDEMKALQRLNTLYFLVGYLGFLITWILDLINALLHPAHVGSISAAVQAVLRTVSPHFCFAKAVFDVQQTYSAGQGGFPPGIWGKDESPFAMDIFGWPMLHMALQTVVYGALVLAIDGKLLRRIHFLLRQHLTHLFHKLVRRSSGRSSRSSSGRLQGGYMAVGSQPSYAHGEAGGLLDTTADVEVADEDIDVREERLRVQQGRCMDAQVLLQGVTKSYSQGFRRPPVHAVRGLSVGVRRNECFGLLGVNGAGKTTTFKMLTGEVLPDTGDAAIVGRSVLTELAAARQLVGYCPQFEALPGAMTGREVLFMYARLRGVPESSIPAMSQHLLHRLGLARQADLACGTYSGGNKRKLSVAVSMVGAAPVVLMDEPSSGMDPSARRFLWTVLQQEVIGAGRTVILTSHSMEECDALCTRLGVMAAGRLACIGTVQHLKGRFGTGYRLELRVEQPQVLQPLQPLQPGSRRSTAGETGAEQGSPSRIPATKAALSYITSVCPDAHVVEEEANRLVVSIPTQGLDLASLFEAIELRKDELGITDYSVSQTTLEQVFVGLAKAHAAPSRQDSSRHAS